MDAVWERRWGAHAICCAVLIVCTVLLNACDQTPSKSQDKSPTATELTRKFDEDTALLKALDFGEPELERRLLAKVKVEDGVVFIRRPGESLGSYALPATIPWLISCGVGLSVSFGTSIAPQASDVDEDKFDIVDGVKLYLSIAEINDDQCAVLAPKLGKRLKTLLQEPGHSR